jgi:hypothetical protein
MYSSKEKAAQMGGLRISVGAKQSACRAPSNFCHDIARHLDRLRDRSGSCKSILPDNTRRLDGGAYVARGVAACLDSRGHFAQ